MFADRSTVWLSSESLYLVAETDEDTYSQTLDGARRVLWKSWGVDWGV